MSLLDLLSAMPSASDRFQQIAPLLQTGHGPGASFPGGGTVGATGDASRWENEAQRYFLSHGYSPQDWNKVDYIIENESNWNPSALNDSSGAAGIAQRISGFGPGYREDNPMQQIKWLLNYLGSHNYEGYGTGIDAAYAHKQDTGWY